MVASTTPGTWIDHGNFDAHTGLEGAVGFGDSLNSPIDHRIYEFKIPLSLLGASPRDTIVFASVPDSIPYDETTGKHNVWPAGVIYNEMATWGDLVLASAPPPAAVPTLLQWGLIGMALLFTAVLIRSVRRRWIVNADDKVGVS